MRKQAVWRDARGGDTWHRYDYSWARVNGWKLELRGQDGRWWFYAHHRNGEDVFNSAWEGYSAYFSTKEAAQRAAERGAWESWAFLKQKEN